MNGPFDVQALYAALDARRAERALSWAGVAREIGRRVSASTITRTQHAADLEADGMLQMVRWLGCAPESFARDRDPAAPPIPWAAPPCDAPGVLRVDTAALHARLDHRRAERGLTWKQVAGELEAVVATPAALGRLRHGGRTTTQLVLAAARWLEVPAEDLTHLTSV